MTTPHAQSQSPVGDTLIFASHDQLTRHPRNIRREYPTAAVRRMGLSQAECARSGLAACVQPLVVTVAPGVAYDPAVHRTFVMVAGHLRHAGNAWLGEKAPPLNCVVRYYATEADMLADMGTENGVREDPGPSGWAIYLRGQLDAGVPMHQLLRRTGLTLRRVEMLLDMAALAPAVQALLDAGRLPLGAIEHLKRIESPARQAKLARKLADAGATLKQIELAVRGSLNKSEGGRKTADLLKVKREKTRTNAPALDGLPDELAATLGHVRGAAAVACSQCDVGAGLPFHEPAWHVAVEAVMSTCHRCDLRAFETVCKSCPLAEAMRGVVKAVRDQAQAQTHEVPA